MSKSYRVQITEIESDVPSVSKEWERKWTDATFERLQRDSENPPESQYGYVATEGTKEVSKEIYDQTVDSLDLQMVVAVVNGIREIK